MALPHTSLAEQPTGQFDKARVEKILAMPHRDAEDRQREADRTPVQAMAYWGLAPNMKVIEFGPGGGWYTKILAPYLADEGELYLVSSAAALDALGPILKKKNMRKAIKQPIDVKWDENLNRYALGTSSFGVAGADRVLNIREYHGFDEEGAKRLNKAAFDALKPGGKYVIVDHSKRHMAPHTDELSRRVDPVRVILEVQAAGFVLESSSNMFYRPDDELRYEVGRKTVAGNTDRFSLMFKKPDARQ
jgi:predicted methyltransferase